MEEGPYPWAFEPDLCEFTDPITGYHCRIVRMTTTLALCGYVGVSKEHPFYNSDFHPTNESPYAYGEITHTGFLDDQSKLWWFGFDCMHAFDLMPVMFYLGKKAIPRSVVDYKTMTDVAKGCIDLAYELHRATVRASLPPDLKDVDLLVFPNDEKLGFISWDEFCLKKHEFFES